MSERPKEDKKLVCSNRRARRNYRIEETYEAGLVLTGSEVKALRAGQANLSDAYARPRGNELFMLNAHISPYDRARDNHVPERERKLLMHRREITKLSIKLRERGFTLIPLELYFKGSHAKVSLGLARGKREYDKRQDISKRETDRKLSRILKRHTRR